MKKVGWSDYNRWKNQKNLSYRRQAELSIDRMDKIKNHKDTETIQYPDFKNSFDYVDGIFPEANVKDVVIYMCNRDYLEKIGLKGIGGCYNKICQTVVVSDDLDFVPSQNKDTWGSIVAKVETDEVIVHELLHYVSLCNGSGSTSNIEEEFAYGNSIGYLRSKGKTDEDIAVDVFLPHFMQAINSKKISRAVLIKNGYKIKDILKNSDEKNNEIFKKLDKPIFEATRKDAHEMAHLLITVYDAERIEYSKSSVKAEDSFGMMDFGL